MFRRNPGRPGMALQSSTIEASFADKQFLRFLLFVLFACLIFSSDGFNH